MMPILIIICIVIILFICITVYLYNKKGKNNKTESFQGTTLQNPITIADMATSVMTDITPGNNGSVLRYNGVKWEPYIYEVATYNLKGNATDIIDGSTATNTTYVMNLLIPDRYKAGTLKTNFLSNKATSGISVTSPDAISRNAFAISKGINYMITVTVNKYITSYGVINNLTLYLKGITPTGNIIIAEDTVAISGNNESFMLSASGFINNTSPENNNYINYITAEIALSPKSGSYLKMTQTIACDTCVNIVIQEV